MNKWTPVIVAVLMAVAASIGAQELVVEGTVKRANGRPAPSVLVAAIPHAGDWWSVAAVTRTARDGTFRFSGLPAGQYALTATSARDSAGFIEKVTGPADITMGRRGRKLTGTARHENGEPLRGRVTAARLSSQRGDLFVMETDAEGRFAAMLPPGRYRVFTEAADGKVEQPVDLQSGDEFVPLQLERVFHVTPPAVVEWVRREAVVLATPEPGHGFEDMQPLRRIVGNSRIVALGESTHGTREFFQLKHRMLEFLVREMGFTAFAIEASMPDTKAVHDYVLYGEGEPEEAVAAMGVGAWNTEEMVNMVRWMRAYNEDPRNTTRIRFYGFDMQNPKASVRILREYLDRVDPDFARRMALTSIDDLERALTENRQRYAAASSQTEWAWARRQIDLVRQGEELMRVTARASAVRDRWMAANVKWILDHEPAGSKIVLWAHNGHVAAEPPRFLDGSSMGEHLRSIYGDAVRIFGFAFNGGRFRALDTASGELREYRVQAAKPASVDGALAAAGIPLFAIDLRTATGVARRWLESPVEQRVIGTGYDPAFPGNYWAPLHPLRSYDALIFVDETTATQLSTP
ncbi:MAG TPA: erythromycin esterase family protein [Thermoanaerobaculia bacterium]|nr:erythromycin esterase family protein [Thermoanaerobaculia bacterium]